MEQSSASIDDNFQVAGRAEIAFDQGYSADWAYAASERCGPFPGGGCVVVVAPDVD